MAFVVLIAVTAAAETCCHLSPSGAIEGKVQTHDQDGACLGAARCDFGAEYGFSGGTKARDVASGIEEEPVDNTISVYGYRNPCLRTGMARKPGSCLVWVLLSKWPIKKLQSLL